MTALPTGFRVRIRDDVRRLEDPDGALLLVGGSPLRALRLAAAAATLIVDGTLAVTSPTGAALARRLLDGNLADPHPTEQVTPEKLTVVVPVRDRADQLDRCLRSLAGLRVLVVDDASIDHAEVAAAAERHGAEVLTMPVNRGPAVARNEGLARVTTPYVAFVDCDVWATSDDLVALARHFADPRVALVGPHVRGRAVAAELSGRRRRWHERFDEHTSSLALGTRPCSVRPGAAVGWLPSACVIGRVAALRSPEIGGFAPDMRVGEDVDLVWRLVAAGHVVRYVPDVETFHETRDSVRGWLGRKLTYGSGGAPLADRHGNLTAPAVLSRTMAVAGVAVLLRRWWSAPAGVVATLLGARAVATALPGGYDTAGRLRLAAPVALSGLGWAVRQESALLLRHWWPATAVAATISSSVRRMVATALVVDTAVAAVERPGLDPVTAFVGRRLDDAAYGAGLWLGALRARSVHCLLPRFVAGRPRNRA